jgi:hypothetical protein
MLRCAQHDKRDQWLKCVCIHLVYSNLLP